MQKMLLGFAAAMTVATLTPAPAQADPSKGAFTGIPSHGAGHSGFRGDFRRDRRSDDGVVFYDSYRDYQGDTAWKSDSFNDWWHDRPDRAYPRWVTANKNCERKWWAGDTLRC